MKNSWVTRLGFVLGVGLSGVVSAAPSSLVQGPNFLPPNQLNLEDRVDSVGAIDEQLFNQIIDEIIGIYAPIVREHGATLVASKRWNDSTVNAYAQQNGGKWLVTMFGGLARRPEVTPDGFAMVVCHELGHHLAGYAFYEGDWGASEGQADYFATHACAKKIWGKKTRENRLHQHALNRYYEKGCNAAWGTASDRALCYRVADASQSLANLLSQLGRDPAPSFDTPDRTVVRKTDTSHPRGQCRLDTFFQGSLCKVPFDDTVIPGKGSPAGQDSLDAEKESAQYSCHQSQGFSAGARPLCWFAPRI